MSEKSIDEIQKVIQDAVKASCTIYVKTRKKSWSGSGFHIGNGLVVTASHVAPPELMNSGEITLTFDKQIFYTANVRSSDPTVDAAILQVKGDYSSIASVALANSESVQLGEIVSVIGAPEGWSDTVTVGRVSNVHQYMGAEAPSEAWNDVIFVDAKILQGVSGGMCIATDGLVIGSVIGITGMLADYGIGENVICPSNKILNVLNQSRPPTIPSSQLF
jgi:S1-C subfamily serine protease